MPALVLDLAVEQGTTWAHGFLPQINGTNVLGAGWTGRAQARAEKAATEVLHEWSSEIGNLAIDPDVGSVTLAIDPAESSAWDWPRAYYDVEVTSPDGEVTYRVAQGRIRLSPEVTR